MGLFQTLSPDARLRNQLQFQSQLVRIHFGGRVLEKLPARLIQISNSSSLLSPPFSMITHPFMGLLVTLARPSAPSLYRVSPAAEDFGALAEAQSTQPPLVLMEKLQNPIRRCVRVIP